ncbi:hypothetical protein [Butyrivibrio sp. AE2015]|uniref:hypothetical protein n=1 Tax=Butyrivibrio sp. AE2015 TaxID=1280663 RepID=UPI0003B6B5EF|nr:hypothetical protein [Butyrivibrio sp. AE2015]
MIRYNEKQLNFTKIEVYGARKNYEKIYDSSNYHDYSCRIHGTGWFEGHVTDEDRIGDKIARILNVPEDYELVCILPVGIAEGEPMTPPKKSFEERAWFNSFNGK